MTRLTKLFLGSHARQPTKQWVQFLLSCGLRFAEARTADQRSVLVLVLPTRAYAAPLLSIGVTVARSRVPLASTNLDEHFRQLCEMPIGARVVYTDRQKRYEGIVAGSREYGGDVALYINVAKEHNTHFAVMRQQANRVEVSDWEGALSDRVRGRRIAKRVSFVEALLDGIDTRDFLTKTRLEALLIGNSQDLVQEIKYTSLASFAENDQLVEGTIQDLLRVRQILPGQAYRTEIVSHQTGQSFDVFGKSNAAIIFDGSPAFLKHRHRFMTQDRIVILDRTSHGFDDAVQAVNDAFINANREEESVLVADIESPWGTEILAYKEVARE